MTAIDIILLLIFIVSAWLGFRKGIIRQFGSLAAIVLAIVACRAFVPALSGMIMDGHPDWENSAFSHYGVSILASGIIYLAVYYAVVFIARLLHKVSHMVLLGPVDHIAGAAFSVAKYFMLVSLVLNLYIVLFPSNKLAAGSHLCNGKVVEATIGFAPWALGALTHRNDGDTCIAPAGVEKAPADTHTDTTI